MCSSVLTRANTEQNKTKHIMNMYAIQERKRVELILHACQRLSINRSVSCALGKIPV